MVIPKYIGHLLDWSIVMIPMQLVFNDIRTTKNEHLSRRDDVDKLYGTYLYDYSSESYFGLAWSQSH
jgi:hypothetical protein